MKTTVVENWVERIRRGQSIPPLLGLFLSSLTPLTRAGMFFRHISPKIRVDAYVISIGNLTVGGTGKTPAVIERAAQEVQRGRKVAVLTRGYGSDSQREMVIVPPSEKQDDLKVPWLGDEPELIRKCVPQVVIGKGANRIKAAQRLIQDFGCNTLILDDGFQYVMLERDENILLIDATNPFGNGRLIPRGILREPITAARRATQIVLTRCDLASELDETLATIRAICPSTPIRLTRHAPSHWVRLIDGSTLSLEKMRGEKATALCAIGNPEAFLKTLEVLGVYVTQRVIFPDHFDIPHEMIPREGIVLTTEKDAVRLKQVGENVYSLVVRLKDML